VVTSPAIAVLLESNVLTDCRASHADASVTPRYKPPLKP
jgi:hypothetical protein